MIFRYQQPFMGKFMKIIQNMINLKLMWFLLVLNDPDKRAIYDIYGQKGLDANWEVIYINS